MSEQQKKAEAIAGAIQESMAILGERSGERADVLAFLRKRRASALTIAARNPGEAERAKIIADQIGIEIEMIEQGLHVGDAAVEAALSVEG